MIGNNKTQQTGGTQKEDCYSAFESTKLLCPYCGQPAKLIKGSDVYWQRHLQNVNLWRCIPCAAHVNCHEGTIVPLGRLGNADLRKAKMRAHAAFDPLWRGKLKHCKRKEAYKWLAMKLGIKEADCHIGEFDIKTCDEVVFFSKQCMVDMTDLDRHLGCVRSCT